MIMTEVIDITNDLGFSSMRRLAEKFPDKAGHCKVIIRDFDTYNRIKVVGAMRAIRHDMGLADAVNHLKLIDRKKEQYFLENVSRAYAEFAVKVLEAKDCTVSIID